jgi:hypothetical protein
MDATGWPDSWFFIIGCQRSGTTLMRLVLECHSEVECRDEVVSYGTIGGRRTTARTRRLLGLKVPCLTEQFASPTLWDVAWVPEVPNGYRGHPLIFMIRDARDTVASMMGLQVFGRSWVESSLESTLQAKVERDPAFAERYASALSLLDWSRRRDPAKAALYWRYKSDALFDYLSRRFPVLLVRYEDVVRQPQLELLRVCGFLRIPWERGLLNHPGFTHRELDSAGIAMGGTNARRPIDRESVGKWRNALTEEQAADVLRFAGTLQADLYSDAVPQPSSEKPCVPEQSSG